MLLLQTAELTKVATEAASNVTHHASSDAFTSLSWLLNLVFGALLGLLIYKMVWKNRPVERPDFDALQAKVAEDKAAHAADIADLRAAFAERKASADQIRVQDKLKVEADFAAVATTLNRLAEVADTLTTMTERVSWHGKQLDTYKEQFERVHQELDEVKKDIKQLYRDGAART